MQMLRRKSLIQPKHLDNKPRHHDLIYQTPRSLILGSMLPQVLYESQLDC